MHGAASPPPAWIAEHREKEPPEMLLSGLRPQALAALCLCAVVLACAVGEKLQVGGHGDPEAAWDVWLGQAMQFVGMCALGEYVSVAVVCEVCMWVWNTWQWSCMCV